ncbi:MAG: helix-hairpin-helix domain-containing protein [candidate division WOR-3 bacterium]
MIILLLICSLDATIFESEEQKDLETYLFKMEELKENPVDINTANLEELLKIPFLKIPDALKIVAYRDKYGPFENLEDLYRIPSIDSITIAQLRPYLTVKKKPLRLRKIESRIRFKRNLKENGSITYYTRNIVGINDYTIFLITERDPYENSFFDYYSTGVLIEEQKRHFIMGRYNLDFGSGVMLSSTGSFFQGIDFRMLTSQRGIIPYTSTMENGGFFGAALSDSLLLNYCLFYSNQRLDGTVDTAGYARSFDESGEHIDSLSQSRKDRIMEEIFGYNVQYRYGSLLFSNSTYWSGYEPAFACDDSLTGFYGSNYWISGVDLKFFAEKFLVFGEVVRSFRNRPGGILGWSGVMPYNFEFNLATKYFSPGFYAPKGVESDEDHIGVVIDFNNRSRFINAGTTFNVFTDCNADTSNYDLRLNLAKIVGFVEFKSQLRWLFHAGIKELSGSKIFLRLFPKNFLYFNLRLEDKYSFDDTIFRGIAGALDIGLDTKFVEFVIRLAVFDSENYKTRIFVFEPDLPGVINNRMLYGKGECGLIFIKLSPINKFNISLKYFAMNRDSLSQQFGIQLDTRWW